MRIPKRESKKLIWGRKRDKRNPITIPGREMISGMI